jgi:hypothetical protein
MGDPVEILSKLFDNLKDASNRTEAATQKLIDQQMEVVGHIKAMPINDIRKALDEHAMESRTTQQSILSRVTKMLIIVSVAVTVSTLGYFMIRYTAENQITSTWEKKYIQIKKEEEKQIDAKLEYMMEQIREEMNELHQGKDLLDNESIHN